MAYEYLDNVTGDAEFIVKAKSLEELLEDAGRTMVSLMYDREKLEPREELDLEAEGEDPEELLYNWLSEILVIQDSQNFFFKDFQVEIEKTNKGLVARGKCLGQLGDPNLVKAYVKAVTLHNFYVKETSQGWEARVVVDL